MRTIAFWTMFILLLVVVVMYYFQFDELIETRTALGECTTMCIEKEPRLIEAMDCNCEKCPEIDEDFLAFCESLPINQEAVEIPVEPIIDLPIEPVIVESEWSILKCDSVYNCLEWGNSSECSYLIQNNYNNCQKLLQNSNSIVEPIVDLPIEEPIVEPECIKWNYYFSNEVCEEWK